SAGPLARARRIASSGQALLAERPVDGDAEALSAWRLKLEGVAREMDAGFAPESLPDDLKVLRAEVAGVLTPGAESSEVEVAV
ncbi:AAA family ATPase, partial [Myxococcus sp. 1LA]